MKIKALINEAVKINSTALSSKEDPAQVMKLMENVEELGGEANSLQLNNDSRQFSDTVVGYIFHKKRICKETVAKAK